MSIQSVNRQLVDAELAADEPGLSKSERRRRLAKVEGLRMKKARLETRESRQLEERGRRASARRW